MNKLSLLVLLAFIFYMISCQGAWDQYKDLSNDYWYKDIGGGSKTIESKNIKYKNKIYPVITDFVFDQKFIIAEQKPDSIEYISLLGEDLLRRFEDYKMYKKNKDILKDPFYFKLKGVVEKDSMVYNLFLSRGATNDESNNLFIGIQLAKYFINNDPYYRNIFNNKINYWIIHHPLDTLIGPLTKYEYLDKKNSLGIPYYLKLKFEK